MSFQNFKTTAPRGRSILRAGLGAGVAGGIAEIVWIGLVAPVSTPDPTAVARGVAEAVFPSLGAGSGAVVLGLAIHMVLALVLGVALAAVLRRALPVERHGSVGEAVLVVSALAIVWAVNFFVVLPMLSPTFLTLVPLWSALVSKLLFGVVAALVFLRSA